MRVSKAIAALSLTLLAFTGHASTQSPAPPTGSFVAGDVLVKFRPGASAGVKADAHALAGGTPLNEITRTGVQRVSVPAGAESAAIARYQRNPNVLYAEPNYIRSIPEPVSHGPASLVVPSDYYFDEEYGLHNIGQTFQCLAWLYDGFALPEPRGKAA